MAKPLVSKASNLTDKTLQHHIRELTALREKLDSANGSYRAGIKAAKQDGIKTSMLLEAMKSKKREQDDVTSDLRDLVRYLALVNMPVTQADLFGSEANENGPGPATKSAAVDHSTWEAEQAGKKAGLDGRPKEDNPHVAGSENGQSWHRGWLRGQEELARGSKAGVKPASTRKTRATAAMN